MRKAFLSIGLVSLIVVPVVVVVSVIPGNKIKNSAIAPNESIKSIYLTNVKALSNIEEVSSMVNLSNEDIQRKLAESQPLISNASLNKPMSRVRRVFKGHKINGSIKYTFENRNRTFPTSNRFAETGNAYTFNTVMNTMLNIEKNHEEIVKSDKEKELLESSYKVKRHTPK